MEFEGRGKLSVGPGITKLKDSRDLRSIEERGERNTRGVVSGKGKKSI